MRFFFSISPFYNETVWLTQAQMAELFQKDRTVIGRHIRNIFKEGELDKKVVSVKIAHTTQHGAMSGKTQRQEVTMYNLDVVISVGYRVHSIRGTRFRQWANSVLKDYLVKGYAINQRIREENYRQMVQLVRSMARTVKLENLTSDVRNFSLSGMAASSITLVSKNTFLICSEYIVPSRRPQNL